jgi:HK97 gp10 family phage protein
MKFKHRWHGDGDLKRTFREMDAAMSRAVLVRAGLDAVEPMRVRAGELAPRSNGPGPHLADNIVAAETAFGANGNVSGNPDVVAIAVGPSHQPNDMFYGMFQEFGTAHHPAQPFLRPAFDQQHKETTRRFGLALGAEIARRLSRRST